MLSSLRNSGPLSEQSLFGISPIVTLVWIEHWLLKVSTRRWRTLLLFTCQIKFHAYTYVQRATTVQPSMFSEGKGLKTLAVLCTSDHHTIFFETDSVYGSRWVASSLWVLVSWWVRWENECFFNRLIWGWNKIMFRNTLNNVPFLLGHL